jgi:hypothetical protein
MPSNYVSDIVIDTSWNKWIATSAGLVHYDGVHWFVYDTSNSGIPSNRVQSIAIDNSGTKWLGTSKGLAKYDGSSWQVYNMINSGIIHDYIYTIAIDKMGNKWMGTHHGVAVYNAGGVVTDVEKNDKSLPAGFMLSQNYPNPFNPSTTISYTVANGHSPLLVDLSIYNVLGQKVCTLISEKQNAGEHTVEWNASGFSSGIYFYRVHAGDFVHTKRMVLIK